MKVNRYFYRVLTNTNKCARVSLFVIRQNEKRYLNASDSEQNLIVWRIIALFYAQEGEEYYVPLQLLSEVSLCEEEKRFLMMAFRLT